MKDIEVPGKLKVRNTYGNK